MTAPRADNWDGILDEGERILWQGAPDPGFALKGHALFAIPFAIFFTGFSIFWMAMAAQSGGFFWMFGLIFFFVGAKMLVWNIIGDTLTRRSTFYTLTNRRAFIATNLPFQGKRLRSFPIKAGTDLDYRPGEPFGAVFFTKETKRSRKGTYDVPIGFERISNARDVLVLLRQLPTEGEVLSDPDHDESPAQ